METTARTQVLEVISEPTSLNLDEICDARSIDDILQPVIQALVDNVKPPPGSLRDCPEEARVLFSEWDSLVLEEGVTTLEHHGEAAG